MKRIMEGSMAVAEAVKVCRPHVIAAYPITPQTHIVEDLAQMVANGELKSEFVNVESEFGAASVVLGASAAGARAFSASSSQGLLLMAEVLFNLAGMRLPVVLACANRSVSAPINIWNDQQDAATLRDAGIIQFFAEDNQELHDLVIQAYRVAEDPEISLPCIVNLDGFILTHGFEPVEACDQKLVDEFLPSYKPLNYLDVKNPMTFGALFEPTWYQETRYRIQETMEDAKSLIEEVAKDFEKKFGRFTGGLIEEYKMDGAETVFVSMGSVVGTIKDAVDELRRRGERAGVLKVRVFRPFPTEAIIEALKGIKNVIVMEKMISLGAGGILAGEIKQAFYRNPQAPRVDNFIFGLGGRDIPLESIEEAFESVRRQENQNVFVDLRQEALEVAY
jgi:pyruvate ferredoxin oxidoreductase alpha subunit